MFDEVYNLSKTELYEFKLNISELINSVIKQMEDHFESVKMDISVGFHLSNERYFYGTIKIVKFGNDVDIDSSNISEYDYADYSILVNINENKPLLEMERYLGDSLKDDANNKILSKLN